MSRWLLWIGFYGNDENTDLIGEHQERHTDHGNIVSENMFSGSVLFVGLPPIHRQTGRDVVSYETHVMYR